MRTAWAFLLALKLYLIGEKGDLSQEIKILR